MPVLNSTDLKGREAKPKVAVKRLKIKAELLAVSQALRISKLEFEVCQGGGAKVNTLVFQLQILKQYTLGVRAN